MKWNSVVIDVNSMDVEEAKAYIGSHPSDSFQLVDVRQPEEYSKRHLPGATLLPLEDLVDGKGNLDKMKPVLLYSRSGGRSLVGAQWLTTQGFSEIWNITGGIKAWQGEAAFGHYKLNLNLLDPEADFPDAISMAYAMEEGLQLFYILLARETKEEMYKRLYRKLAAFEVDHKRDLSQMYSITQGKELIQKEIEEHDGQIMEGGGYADITLIKTLANTESAYDVFSLAIAFEAQALDFYSRLSTQAVRPEVKKFFLEMADAEKKHLLFVSKEMDKYIEQEKRFSNNEIHDNK
ncbi:sulfurtransferase [bacterium]|nr:sulfurtransferase [bacterium]